jgi:hypothetical protein
VSERIEVAAAARPNPRKEIVQSDIMDYLEGRTFPSTQAVVASIPDSAELPNSAIDPWREWFSLVAERIIAATHPDTPIVFYQSDVRHAGTWIDKGFLVQEAAKKQGATLLLHRIVCRKPAGTVTFGRAVYSHLMLFSKNLKNSQRYGYSDVIPDGGPAAWVRGIGLHSCEAIVRMIRQESACDTLVHLFCGKGLLLEVARDEGLHVIGVDLSKKQCRHAERFSLQKFKAAQGDRRLRESIEAV